ncbi:MAG: protein jag [Chloroflexota bacterium]|nr:protein jag [Chloroflexota bacterium]
MSAKSLEVSGKSVEDAIDKGLAALGLPRDAVSVEIVHAESHGLLGLRNEEAVVRLSPLEAPAPVAADSDATNSTAKETLETLLHGMGLSAHVQVLPDAGAEDSSAIVLNIVGDDLGVLIGRRGETLRDLEYLTRLLVAHQTAKSPRLVVDVEGYRTRRERSLRELAKRMAERVQANRQPITLEAMPPNERRIVHISLREHPTVKTQSIGEGDHRRVMIIPK